MNNKYTTEQMIEEPMSDVTTKQELRETAESIIWKFARWKNGATTDCLNMVEAQEEIEKLLALQRTQLLNEVLGKIDLMVKDNKEHTCRFNDGKQDCDCYLEGLNRVKRQLSYEARSAIEKMREEK